MMEAEFENAKIAFKEYNLNSEYEITQKILRYIYERIIANKEEIKKILNLSKNKYSYEDVINRVKEIISEKIEYKKQVNITKRQDGFVSAIYKTAIGVVAVESFDLLESIKYMLEAVKTRNAIILSDVEYKEDDDKHLLLLIIQDALGKFNINSNLIQILPYEECDYTKCDKVIYTYENKNIENRYKIESKKLYIYIENKELRDEAKKEYEVEKLAGANIELLEGSFNDVLEKINKEYPKGAVIYTKDKPKAYKFITFVNSKNVFVNATLQNIEEVKKCKNELLINKKIMYEMIDM